MAEDRESSDRKHEKSKKRDRRSKVQEKVNQRIWTETEKMQLAEAIDMYGISDVKRLASRVPTKTPKLIVQKLQLLWQENRKEIKCQDMQELSFVDMNAMENLFMVGNTKPKDALINWIEFLESFYNKDQYKYNKFKLFSNAFLIMSECLAPIESIDNKQNDGINFKEVYYTLYRIFNNYFLSKHSVDTRTKQYLQDLFKRVLEEIKYSSNNEKKAMCDMVFDWRSVNRLETLKVYGKTINDQPEHEEETSSIVKKNEYMVLQQPMIPSMNPFRILSSYNSCKFD